MIKVFCATHPESGRFKDWYSDVSIIGNRSAVPDNIDLLILTGGSDIDPKKYGGDTSLAYDVDPKRDEEEMTILDIVLNTTHAKVLGVCRGMQLLTVYYGGKLFGDLGKMGSSHTSVHDLKHIAKSPMDWLTTVNSLHHQGIATLIGSSRLLAIEPTTEIPEAVLYHDRILGVQFHPEMFGVKTGNRFFSMITDWVMNNTPMAEKWIPPTISYTMDFTTGDAPNTIWTTIGDGIMAVPMPMNAPPELEIQADPTLNTGVGDWDHDQDDHEEEE